jgi:phosphoinositide-3-kinase regulatory subunit 4
LKTWHVGVASTGRSVRIHQVSLHPTKGKGKWVMVAVETTSQSTSSTTMKNLIEVWDIERSALVETFVTRSSETDTVPEPQELTGVDGDPSPSAAIAALVRSRQSTSTGKQRQISLAHPSLDVRTMVVGTDFGSHSSHRHDRGDASRSSSRPFVISGSDDRKIRYWDLHRAERSVQLSGGEADWERPSYKYVLLSLL